MNNYKVGDVVLYYNYSKSRIKTGIITEVDNLDSRLPIRVNDDNWLSTTGIINSRELIKVKVKKHKVIVSTPLCDGISATAKHNKKDGEFDLQFGISLALMRLAEKLDTGRTTQVTEYAKEYI